MSSRQAKIIGVATAAFAGLAGGEAVTYMAVHQTIHLIVALIAALIVVTIIGTVAIKTRRRQP